MVLEKGCCHLISTVRHDVIIEERRRVGYFCPFNFLWEVQEAKRDMQAVICLFTLSFLKFKFEAIKKDHGRGSWLMRVALITDNNALGFVIGSIPFAISS